MSLLSQCNSCREPLRPQQLQVQATLLLLDCSMQVGSAPELLSQN